MSVSILKRTKFAQDHTPDTITPEVQQNQIVPSLEIASQAISDYAGCTPELATEFIKWLDDKWVYPASQSDASQYSRLIINGEYVRYHDILDAVFPDYSCPLPGGVGDIVQQHLGGGNVLVRIDHHMTGPGTFNYCKVDLRLCCELTP